LEPDARWLLIIAIILAMRNARIGPKWILLFIASYAISTFISAVMETNYLRALGARANGDENAVPYGMFNATIALMLLVFFINPNLNKLFSQEPNKTPENNNRKNVIIRSLLFLLFTLSVIAAFLSGTRAAVLLLPVVMIGLYIIRYPIKKALIGLTIILGLGTVLITQSKSVLVYKLISTPTTVTSYFVNNDRASKLKNQRLEQWKESACIFTLHPLLGTGPRSFKYAHQTYGSENYCNAVQFLKQGSDQAHSVYFNTLGTLGLAGIITTLLLSLALLRSGINASQQANPTSKLGGSLLITVLACHAINGITLDLWFMNHMMDKNLLVLALPLLLIFHNRAPSKES
jgi:Lipid A core - O-antigen ligase and related enzymes